MFFFLPALYIRVYQALIHTDFIGPKLWNKLSKDSRRLSSLGAFKRNIRQQDLLNSVLNNCSN